MIMLFTLLNTGDDMGDVGFTSHLVIVFTLIENMYRENYATPRQRHGNHTPQLRA